MLRLMNWDNKKRTKFTDYFYYFPKVLGGIKDKFDESNLNILPTKGLKHAETD